MKVTINADATTRPLLVLVELERCTHAALSRFGAELTSVRIGLAWSKPNIRCRARVRGPRFSEIEVRSEGGNALRALAASLDLVQTEVAAALARTRSTPPLHEARKQLPRRATTAPRHAGQRGES